ncbi:MAG: amidohydrolase family protein, partial [Acidimicrobiales bacterium]
LASDRSTLAGSVLTMERAVRHMVDATGMPLADALRAASATPMRVAGGPGHGQGAPPAGTLEPGAPADLVVLDPDLEVVATIVAGVVAFARDQLLT